MNKTILVVEDQKDLQGYLKEFLTDNGYLVLTADDGIPAMNIINKKSPDLIILDLNLPNMSGESVLSEVRKKFPDTRVIVLTAKNNTQDIVTGFDLGADDYMSKPFKLEELLARIKVRLKDGNSDGNKKTVADLELNTDTHEVKRDGKKIILSPTEFKLLDYLMENKGKVLSREMILSKIWMSSPDIETRAVDVYVGYLRKKVDSASSRKLIHSIRGFGYVLKED
jgi:DNA-binding response OmpR family regulator